MKPTYEELEAKCAALAAELRAVEAIHNEAVFITDDHYEQCPAEVQKIIRSLAVMQIPAYQAFLAEVRAQGVDEIAELYLTLAHHEANRSIAESWLESARFAKDHAAQIRKGALS
ncbi:TPA: hypothetical protein ACK1JP_000611 [Enterobacter hormaechei]